MARNLTSGAVTVDDLPPVTVAFIRRQGTTRGLDRDPLAEVTHGLRVDEETMNRQRVGPRSQRHTTELLLTPELLIISYRQGSDDAPHVDPAARVGFHRLDQLEVAVPAAGLQKRAPGAAPAAGVVAVTSTPLGGTRRTTRHVASGIGPEVTRFWDALQTAVARTRPA
ncbi:hypothetical protein [Actinomycetospora cinnamomea]|uniref:Uncharacterized protein n=1 Tax=Actinomycetospora cinnamomea TaxID=663609 RepID=A0A2U1FRC7_9PSEU|nr:hypothetical protein [Actinomycetospora cinnamomea]PVZ14727.1 hypothetical protein C8D89_101594 [Actinomycetospora cinnamomea]